LEPNGGGKLSPLQADLILLIVTLIWGGTFPVLKILVAALQPLYLVGIRFLLAFILLTPFAWPRLRWLDRKTVGTGITLGLLIWGGFLSQTIGIQYTTASKAAFITALSVVITPVLAALLLRKKPEKEALVGVVLATLGLGLLTLDFADPWTFQRGDLWVLACAFLYALQIITVHRYGSFSDALLLTWMELGTVAVVGLGVAVMIEPLPQLNEIGLWGCLIYLAFFATAVAQYLQIRVQPHTTPTRVSLIFSLEPVFAAMLAFLFLGERLHQAGQLGAFLMLIGVLVSEMGHRGESQTQPVSGDETA
jgi:drug/metabolite transporter (DMT)-like permease